MHTIHTTPALVVGSKPNGEASKLIFLFTREFGLITAVAQGIRFEKSKLRYCAQDYNLGIFSLVKGKEFWRLVGAEELPRQSKSRSGISANKSDADPSQSVSGVDPSRNKSGEDTSPSKSDLSIGPGEDMTVSPAKVLNSKMQILSPLSLLLRRLLHGEEGQVELFDEIKIVSDFIDAFPSLDQDQMKTLESVVVYRILKMLGYIGKDVLLDGAILSGSLSIGLLLTATEKRELLNKHINKALRESHL